MLHVLDRNRMQLPDDSCFRGLRHLGDVSSAEDGNRISVLDRDDWPGRQQTQFAASARGRQQRPPDVPNGGNAVAKHDIARNFAKSEMRMKLDEARHERRIAKVHFAGGSAAQF